MAKKSTKKSARGAGKAAGTRKRAGGRKGTKKAVSNLDRFRKAAAVDPDAANALNAEGEARVASLTANEVKAMISGHKKLSPGKGFEPDPDGSIF